MFVKRAIMQGFLTTDFAMRYEEGVAALAGWIREGRLRYHAAFRSLRRLPLRRPLLLRNCPRDQSGLITKFHAFRLSTKSLQQVQSFALTA